MQADSRDQVDRRDQVDSMKRLPPACIPVLVDSREQNPLLFPPYLRWYDGMVAHNTKVVVSTQQLEAGDYAVWGFEDVVAVERKGSLDELAKNLLTADYSRQVRAFKKLQGATFRYLLVELTPKQAATPGYSPRDPCLIRSRLYDQLAAFGLSLLWVPPTKSVHERTTVGAHVLQLMWSHIWNDLKPKVSAASPPCPIAKPIPIAKPVPLPLPLPAPKKIG